VEVLNLRRRKGAVVLVAEESRGGNTRDHPYLNEMHSRIEKGYEYGQKSNHQFTTHSFFDTPSPSLTVRPGRGVTVTPVSSGVAVDASTPKIDGGTILGSVECSHQEFRGTMLGNSRPSGSLMYVTEVAVRANARRCGAGAMLMRGVDEVAALRNVESVYLHVDVTNRAACAMYEKCGYRHLDKRMPIYAQFTASLNLHDLATHGRKHYLMCKDLIERTTWLEDDESRWDDCFTDN
jgi:ribosomal protein S18 acetylase RimI-like enzyme